MNTLRNIWEVANEIGLLLKLLIVIIFGLLVNSLRKVENSTSIVFYLANKALAIIAVLVVITLVPSGYSRGYGIGLIGKRDMQRLPIYLCGAIFGGARYSFVYKRLLQ
jgi:hypothetical protein